MQIRALRVFCDIASQRSFSRAAAAHGMTQSAASQIVHHLEQDLSVQLIDRSKRPLVLTAAGQLYFEGLQRVLFDLHTLDQEVRSFGKRLAGQVAVTHPPHFPETELGWFLLDGYERRGLAFEAASAARDYAFRSIHPASLVSYIHRDNSRSIALAERLGAVSDPNA